MNRLTLEEPLEEFDTFHIRFKYPKGYEYFISEVFEGPSDQHALIRRLLKTEVVIQSAATGRQYFEGSIFELAMIEAEAIAKAMGWQSMSPDDQRRPDQHWFIPSTAVGQNPNICQVCGFDKVNHPHWIPAEDNEKQKT